MLRLSESSWGPSDFDVAHACIDSDNHTMGTSVAAFEIAFADYVGAKHAVMVNSGSSANLLGASSIQFAYPPKNNANTVIVPALSWSTTYYPWIQNGYRLRFVDIDPTTYNVDLQAMERAIDPNVVGICVPHILGADAGIEKIVQIANEHNIWVFEDTCESLGATSTLQSGKKLGTYGLLGTYSFFRSHHISTMEGGMLVTNDADIYQLARSKRAHGWGRNIKSSELLNVDSNESWESKYQFYVDGYNLRPLEISGAVGLSQLRQIESFMSFRRANAQFLQDSISDNKNFKLQSQSTTGSWMAFGMTLHESNYSRSTVVQKLESVGVETRPIVTGNFLRQPVIKQLSRNIEVFDSCPAADFVHNYGIMFANHGRDLRYELEVISGILNKLQN